ncbi:MAG: hypothetical protein GX051_07015 [Clostridiales bacterium]|jgi:hypothetical protein|nr:hypothetical protein [Clostridiales bacterium]
MILNIAGLNVKITPRYEVLASRISNEYIAPDSAKPDFSINIIPGYLEQKQKENPHLTLAECEYIWSGEAVFASMLDFGGFMLHSSAVALDGQAYLFSARSGTGKSTHTHLWLDCFGAERAKIINDDKPLLRLIDGKFYAFGSPWSGKTDENLNIKVPVKAIAFLERSQTNSIERIPSLAALPLVLNQTVRPLGEERMSCLLSLLDRLLSDIPVYRLKCDMSHEAVETSYNMMSERNESR